MQALKEVEARLPDAPDGQISLTDPDARSMATSGRGTGMVGYNVQTAVDTTHHLIVAHEVINIGNDRSQLANMSEQARQATGIEKLAVVADRGYFSAEEVLACDKAGITAYVPKPLTSGAKADGRFGKQDFVYMPDRDEYRCPAGHAKTRRFETVDKGLIINVYATPACKCCLLKPTVRLARSAALDVGNMKQSLTPCRNVSARRLSKCVCDGKRWSIHSARSRHGWAPRIS
jgi:hypothetical protein